MTKSKYIRYFKKHYEEIEKKLDLETLNEALEGAFIGVDGVTMGLIYVWVLRNLKGKKYRNKRSDRLFLRWWKSEMRSYLNFGTLDPWCGKIAKHWLLVRKENLEKTEDKDNG